MEHWLASVIIPTDGGAFSSLEFQLSISVFRGRYVAALEQFMQSPENLQTIPKVNDIKEVCYAVAKEESRNTVALDLSDYRIAKSFKDIGGGSLDLNVLRLDRTNPLELLVMGLAVPLAAAVILSGGELQFGPMLKVKLPPIGVGIKQLREALALRPEALVDTFTRKPRRAPDEAAEEERSARPQSRA